MAMPCSPLRTWRPRRSQAWKPATRVASGCWAAIRRVLPQLYRWKRRCTSSQARQAVELVRSATPSARVASSSVAVVRSMGRSSCGVTAMRSDTAEAERAEGGAAGSNVVVPGAQERGRSTLPSRAARPQGGRIRDAAASRARPDQTRQPHRLGNTGHRAWSGEDLTSTRWTRCPPSVGSGRCWPGRGLSDRPRGNYLRTTLTACPMV